MRKIPTLFVRDEQDRRYVTEDVSPGCEWVLAGEGVATRKWDGTCVLVADDGSVWARREVKAGKAEPSNFRAVEHDETTGKTVGWEPADQSGFSKFINEAIEADGLPRSGTYELVGPKVNGNPDGFDQHTLVPHGGHVVADPRTFASIKAFLDEFPSWEGLVYWREQGNPDAGLAKIKRRDFR